MRVLLITGMSGSGKSVVLRVLEDSGYYVIDNLPAPFVQEMVVTLARSGEGRLAIGVDVRSGGESLANLPDIISALRRLGHSVQMLFLTADTPTLVARYSETRRRHPLSNANGARTLEENIQLERRMLGPLDGVGQMIDTSDLRPQVLRTWVLDFIGSERNGITLSFVSFAFKQGVPLDADLVYDVRCLPNPFYDPLLRPLTGRDPLVADFLRAVPAVNAMVEDIAGFLTRWLPAYEHDNRSYLTVAIGCTGGQHRSVYMVETLAARFRLAEPVLVRHRALDSREA
jgi:UPF0042 nucleotide-binding protein